MHQKNHTDSPHKRCSWAETGDAEYRRYHDLEWGVPNDSDRKHFEFLILEGAQAGLSWATVLRKRKNYRAAFAEFDPHKVACFEQKDIERLLQDPGLIRNRLKIESAVNNAQRLLETAQEFGSFNRYIWTFVNNRTIHNRRRTSSPPAQSKESEMLCKDMKKRGFRFVGSIVLYSHMQATGLLNDHALDCFRHAECMALCRERENRA